MKIIMFFLSLAILLSGCNIQNKRIMEYSEAQKNIQEPTNSNTTYNSFLINFKKENPEFAGIDINSIIKRYTESVHDIADIDYNVIKCNFSKSDESKMDVLLDIQLTYDFKPYVEILCTFISQDGGRLLEVFSTTHQNIVYKLVELFDNKTQQLLLITDDSGNGYSIQNVNILSLNSNKNEMNIIFDEILEATPYMPYKETYNSKFYSVSFINKYEFESGENGFKNIIWSSTIYDEESAILDNGKTTFVFNGIEYSPVSYYDYKKIAKEFYDNCPSVK